MTETKEILRLSYISRLSTRQIAALLKVGRSTVSNTCKRYQASGLDLDEVMAMEASDLQERLFRPSGPPPTPTVRAKPTNPTRPIPDMARIHQELTRPGVTRELLWQEYKEAHPGGYSLTQFKTLYRRYATTLSPSMRQLHYGGDKLFVDFSGQTMPLMCFRSGEHKHAERKRAEIFVAVLGASGLTFACATHGQDTESFINAHIQAFAYFGGAPGSLVPDNLKAAVIKHTPKELILNESYADMARHYQTAIVPARVRHPKDKPAVETGVKLIQRWILARLRNHTFFSVQEINEAIAPLLEEFNHKVARRLNKSRWELYEILESPYMRPLPTRPYEYRESLQRTVGVDYHVELEGHGYSVPYTLIGAKVIVWYSVASVQIVLKGEVVAIHPRVYGLKEDSTLIEHMPPSHRYQFEKWNPRRIRSWAAQVGPMTAELIEVIFNQRSHVVRGYRSALAILSFTRRYPQAHLEKAAGRALRLGVHQVGLIESLIKQEAMGMGTAEGESRPPLGSHENIRGSEYYAKATS